MKILYVVNSLVVGGAETIAVNYLIELKRRGHDVALLQVVDCDSFLKTKLKANGISVFATEHYLGGSKSKIGRKVLHAIGFRHYVYAYAPDVIHVHSGLEKMRFVSFPTGRIAYTIHSSYRRCLENGKNHRKCFFMLAKRGMEIISLQEKTRLEVLNDISNAKVSVIPNGLNLRAVMNAHCALDTTRRELDIPEDAFVMGHVGRFHPVKNHEKLLSVFAKVREHNENAYLLLIGGGSSEERQRVSDLAARARVMEYVRMPGLRDDATALMDLMDVVMLPSHSEACPLVLIEAQAKGKRVVVSDAISPEFCVTKNAMRLSLDETDDVWASKVLESGEHEVDSEDELRHELRRFDVETAVNEHERLYKQMEKRGP